MYICNRYFVCFFLICEWKNGKNHSQPSKKRSFIIKCEIVNSIERWFTCTHQMERFKRDIPNTRECEYYSPIVVVIVSNLFIEVVCTYSSIHKYVCVSVFAWVLNKCGWYEFLSAKQFTKFTAMEKPSFWNLQVCYIHQHMVVFNKTPLSKMKHSTQDSIFLG